MRKSTFALALAFLAAIVWLGSQLNQPHAAEGGKAEGQKWEYQISWRVNNDDTVSLNKLGDQRWEMCGAAIQPRGDAVLFFKRSK